MSEFKWSSWSTSSASEAGDAAQLEEWTLENIDTGIKLLAFMVRNTTVGADVLIQIFEQLPAEEQQKVRDAFSAISQGEADTNPLESWIHASLESLL